MGAVCVGDSLRRMDRDASPGCGCAAPGQPARQGLANLVRRTARQVFRNPQHDRLADVRAECRIERSEKPGRGDQHEVAVALLIMRMLQVRRQPGRELQGGFFPRRGMCLDHMPAFANAVVDARWRRVRATWAETRG